MRKWLDDLYAIILKRGFKTLDNSLKNYESNQSTINKITKKEGGSFTIEPNQTISVDLNDYFSLNDIGFIIIAFPGLVNTYGMFLRNYYRNLYQKGSTLFTTGAVTCDVDNQFFKITNNGVSNINVNVTINIFV